ncbi:sulfotransferase-like domain-containing protein [Nocardiopsis valliformis]|uniref:sulfotransferase-like domain-containing protein n=1 Tax=Nocardiopsis valliformis TaxID=239974 RepID=UPI0003466787|nr:sulfotransferase family protein [Nocardiopsis valliformis]
MNRTGNGGRPSLLILWSPPRCRSTVFLRIMHERGDLTTLHEPFSHLKDFGAAEVDGVRCADEQTLMDRLSALSERTTVFVKDTTDFRYPGLLEAGDFLRSASHAFLIRDPREAIASHHRLNPELERDEVGFARTREIFEAVEKYGGEPAVLDSEDLVRYPEATVRAYCERVGLDFRPEAMKWRPALLPQWQRTSRWHTDVAESSGVRLPDPRGPGENVEAHPVLGGYYRYHLPHYEWLRERRVRITP